MPAKVDIPVHELVKLIEEHRGNVSKIGRAVAHHRHTIQARIDESALAAKALADARESRIDDAVDALYEEGIDNRNIAALIFILKADPVAKRRGWGERQEVSGVDGGPIQHEHKGQTHGEPEHLAVVLATLVRAGAFQLPGDGDGDAAEDDGLHPS